MVRNTTTIAPGRECGSFDDACNRAAEFANRHNGGLEMAERFLERAGWLHATFGIEYVTCGGRELAYLNTGDTYSLTLAEETPQYFPSGYNRNHGEVFTTTWGGWYEDVEIEYCEENGVIRCGWCSEFTPCNDEDWRETVCESCGHYVDGSK